MEPSQHKVRWCGVENGMGDTRKGEAGGGTGVERECSVTDAAASSKLWPELPPQSPACPSPTPPRLTPLRLTAAIGKSGRGVHIHGVEVLAGDDPAWVQLRHKAGNGAGAVPQAKGFESAAAAAERVARRTAWRSKERRSSGNKQGQRGLVALDTRQQGRCHHTAAALHT